MNILLLGGTGAMGAHLTEILAQRGCNVVVTSRKDRSDRMGINFIKGNAHDMAFLTPILESRYWDAIIDFMIYTTDEFQRKINKFLSSTNQYVYLSSSRVYADSEGLITEESPRLLDICNDAEYLKTDEYALTKARQENLLFSNTSRNWTIIRPYITFSETRLQLSPVEKEGWLYRALAGKSIFFSSDLADKYTTLTYGYDVARGIAAIVGNNKAYGEAYHITVSEGYKWGDILDLYIKVLESHTGRKLNVIMLDKWDPIIGGSIMQVRWDRTFNRRFNNAKINEFIDTSSFRPTVQSLTECLSVFLSNPSFGVINWANEAGKDRFEQKWTRIGDIPSVRNKFLYFLIRFGIKN